MGLLTPVSFYNNFCGRTTLNNFYVYGLIAKVKVSELLTSNGHAERAAASVVGAC